MIGHDIDAALPELRAQAESPMVDVCDIHRASAGWDEASQETTVTWASVHAGVPCTLLPPSQSDREIITDEVTTREARTIRVPFGIKGIKADDRVTVAGHGTFWVSHVVERTHMTSERLICRRTR
jgi:hypothetical protein